MDVVATWFAIQIQMIWLSVGVRFKRFGCQLIWDSSDLVVNWCGIQVILFVNWHVIQMILVVSWFQIQGIWLSIDLGFKWFWLSLDLRFKWFWLSLDLRFKWFEIHMTWLAIDSGFKWFGGLWTSKNVPSTWCFNSFDSQTVLSPQRGANFPNLPVFNEFDFEIALVPQRGANFVDILRSRSSTPPRFSELTLRAFEASKLWKNTAFRAIPTRQNFSCLAKTSMLSNIDASRPGNNFQIPLQISPGGLAPWFSS